MENITVQKNENNEFEVLVASRFYVRGTEKMGTFETEVEAWAKAAAIINDFISMRTGGQTFI